MLCSSLKGQNDASRYSCVFLTKLYVQRSRIYIESLEKMSLLPTFKSEQE